MIVDGGALKKEMDLVFEKGWFDAGTHHYILGKILSCKLDIQPPARIEAAIKEFRKRPIGRTVENLTWEGKDEALRWVLCQISDKDFGLEEEKK